MIGRKQTINEALGITKYIFLQIKKIKYFVGRRCALSVDKAVPEWYFSFYDEDDNLICTWEEGSNPDMVKWGHEYIDSLDFKLVTRQLLYQKGIFIETKPLKAMEDLTSNEGVT